MREKPMAESGCVIDCDRRCRTPDRGPQDKPGQHCHVVIRMSFERESFMADWERLHSGPSGLSQQLQVIQLRHDRGPFGIPVIVREPGLCGDLVVADTDNHSTETCFWWRLQQGLHRHTVLHYAHDNDAVVVSLEKISDCRFMIRHVRAGGHEKCKSRYLSYSSLSCRKQAFQDVSHAFLRQPRFRARC